MTQEETTREFMHFQSYFYLDWNVINDIAFIIENEGNKKYQPNRWVELLFKNFLDNVSICLPYSEGHIQDILRGDEKHLKTNIDTLQKVSKGWKILEDENNSEQVRVDKFFDLYENIKDTKNGQKFVQSVQSSFWPILKQALDSAHTFSMSEKAECSFVRDSLKTWDDFTAHSYKLIVNNRLEKNQIEFEKIDSIKKQSC